METDFLSPAGKENGSSNVMASTPLSWDATPSPNCLYSSIATLTLDFTSSPFLPLSAAAPRPVLKERNRAVSASPKARDVAISPFSMDDSLLNTPEFKIPSIPRRATPKPTFTAADDSEDDEDDDDDEAGEEEDYVDEVALVAEGHDWSYEENVYSDDGDDADGDVDQEEIFGSSSPHPMSPIAHRGHYSPISYSSSLPSSFPSHYSSPSSSSAASSDTPTSTSHPSSVHSTPPSFSTPPIPNTKTTPFLRLKRDPATNYHHHLNASIVGDANGHTPAGTTPGRSNRPRFHTPPLPSPARTTPFFVSKVRAKERVKTPQAKPLWTRAAEYANGYDDESYDYDEDLEEPELQNSGQRALLCTPPLPSPTRTITFITPYAVKARPRSVSDGQASRGAVVAHDGCLTPVKSEPHDDDDDEMEGVHHQQSPPTAGLRHQLPPSPDFPSPPATTMFLYYRPAKVKREGHASVLMAHHEPDRKEPSPVGANTKAEVKNEKEKSLDSSSSTLNSSEFERERERLERELEQEVLKAVNAQQSPASLPPTSTFHFDAHSPYFAQKFSFNASMMVEETCKVIPNNAMLKYDSEESVSVESLDASMNDNSAMSKASAIMGRMMVADDTITLDVGTAVLMAQMPGLAITPPIAKEEPAAELDDTLNGGGRSEAELTQTFTGGRFSALINQFQRKRASVSVATDNNISRTLAAQQQKQQQRKQFRRPASVSTFTQPKAATEASDTDPVTAAQATSFPFHLFPAAMQEGQWKQHLPRLYAQFTANDNDSPVLSLGDLKTRLSDMDGERICLVLHVLASVGLVRTTLDGDTIGWQLP